MRKLKLIWDFRGPDALKIAQHHEIHLNEYIQQKKAPVTIIGTETLNEMHAIAFLVVSEDKMQAIRDDLKPHRGLVYLG